MEQKLVENDHLKMTAGVDVHAVSYVDDMVGGSKQPVVPATVVDEMVAGGAGSILGTHAVGDKCCSYEDCERPRDGSAYHRIDSRYPPSSLLLLLDILSFLCAVALCCVPPPADSHRLFDRSTAGQKDWSEYHGWILCQACYLHFKRRGTLVRSRHRHRPLQKHEMRCTYPQCENPTQSSRFYQINGNKQAGGQDWRPLDGWVLCRSCFSCYNTRGTLARTMHHTKVEVPFTPPFLFFLILLFLILLFLFLFLFLSSSSSRSLSLSLSFPLSSPPLSLFFSQYMHLSLSTPLSPLPSPLNHKHVQGSKENRRLLDGSLDHGHDQGGYKERGHGQGRYNPSGADAVGGALVGGIAEQQPGGVKLGGDDHDGVHASKKQRTSDGYHATAGVDGHMQAGEPDDPHHLGLQAPVMGPSMSVHHESL